jgi:PAS domain S-box-containing protein
MDLSNITVLLVENDSSTRKQTLALLKEFNFKDVYEAINGEDALEKYTNHSPDMILTTYDMPIINGLEMSIKLKEFNPELPIILLTDSDDNKTIIDAINIGIDGYLFKPINLKQLTPIIEKYAKRILLYKESKKEKKLLQEYKDAIDASAAVTKTNINGIITYANKSFCDMCGYSEEELIGKNHSIVKDPNTPKDIYDDMWSTIEKKYVWKGRMQNLKKDGSVYYEYSVIIPITNENGEIEEYISLRHNITDLYYQEQHLRNRIKKEVKKNLKLHKAKEEENLLEAKFSTIGRMAAGITHEINTPLTYVKGNLEMMIKDIQNLDEDIKQKEYLLDDTNIILEGVNRIAGIVETMREVASHTNETPIYHNVYSSLITALTLSHNKAKHISTIRVQNQTFRLGMDKKKLNYSTVMQIQKIEQVFVIIINNAFDVLSQIKNFNDRLLEITISDEHNWIVIRFQDNGGGIDKKILKKLFNPFESNKTKGGMGIGLNVAKRIVDGHGGKIIASNYKDGALFEIYLPKKTEV